jgi:hypothetical protein
MQMELHHFNMRVPGSSPGGVGNDVVAQMAEHHDEVSSTLVVALDFFNIAGSADPNLEVSYG